MALLEKSTAGASVLGIAGSVPVSVIAVKWHGTATPGSTFKDARGQLASQLLLKEDEERLTAGASSLMWSFDADANLMRLTSEAHRINLAHIFDPYFLLLTATPHNSKDKDFRLFDQDRFKGAARSDSQAVDVSDVARRLVKEDVLKFDGTPLFPECRAYTGKYDLSLLEAKLYMAVADYLQEESNRADNLNNDRKTTVGFAKDSVMYNIEELFQSAEKISRQGET